jgi:molybdopterin converting factor small subunit
MILNIKYLAPYSFVLGKKTASISLPDKDNVSVWELLEYIVKIEPRFTRVAVLERESIFNKLSVIVEGEGIVCDLDSRVQDGANIVLMSPLCGG